MRYRRTLVLGVGIFVLLIVSLQIFLLMVGLEALLTFERRVAWGAAVTSCLLALVSVALYRYLARPPRRDTTLRAGRRGPRLTDGPPPDGQAPAAEVRPSSTTNRHTA
jgi:membrane protein implicated in regulation of membrane protease activity